MAALENGQFPETMRWRVGAPAAAAKRLPKSTIGKSLAFLRRRLLAVDCLTPHSAMFLSAAASIPHPTPPAAAYDLPSVISDLRVLRRGIW